MGLEAVPNWLSTEAVLGPSIKDHETIRHELGCFVDEGHAEKRRPEFSGEVSKALAKRIRNLMGGNVELSYPVLGPDDFVVSSLKEQVQRHNGNKLSGAIDGGVKAVIHEVFECLGLDPRTATKRFRPADVARARALAAWLWVERMGRSQITIADGFELSTSAVGKMLRNLREEEPSKEEENMLNGILRKLTERDDDTKETKKKKSAVQIDSIAAEPSVMVLKRKR
jgi:predicted transcriptional regulator